MDASNTNFVSLVVHWNTKGARFFKEGHFKNAIVCFLKGLRACKLIMAACENDQETNHRTTTPQLFFSLDSCFANDLQGKTQEEGTLTADDNQASYTHDQPIDSPSLSCMTYAEAATIFPAILIFNQGLAQHHYGMKNNRLQHFQKAAKLYECGLKLLIVKDSPWDSSACYIVACLDNMGLIYRYLNQSEVVKKCFQQLLSTLMVLVQNRHDCVICLNEYSFPNISHLIFHGASPAAAA
jgi:tetratricopeptide (TPR) repeat protein